MLIEKLMFSAVMAMAPSLDEASPDAPAAEAGPEAKAGPTTQTAPAAEAPPIVEVTPSTGPTELSDPFANNPQPEAAMGDPFAGSQQQPPGTMGTVTQSSVESEPRQPRTPPAPRKVGFVAGFDMKMSEIDRAFGLTLGGQAGVILLQRLTVSGAGYSLAFHDREYYTLTDTRDFQLNYGGVQFGGQAVKSPRVDGGFSVFLGGGQMCLDSRTQGRCVETTGAVVSHIESTIYVRAASILRLGFGFGYNFIVDTSARWNGPDNWALSGFSGSIHIDFGQFAPRDGGGRGRR